jgi:DNA-binding MarR family transcriptional regulator
MDEPRQAAPDTPSPDDLSERIRGLARALVAFNAAVARDLGLAASDVWALEHLFADGPLGPAEIAARLGMTTASATALVDRLEAAGHVERRPHPTDRRRLAVVPTAHAEAAAFAAIAEMVDGLETVGTALTAEERQAVAGYLDGAVAVFRAFADRRR